MIEINTKQINTSFTTFFNLSHHQQPTTSSEITNSTFNYLNNTNNRPSTAMRNHFCSTMNVHQRPDTSAACEGKIEPSLVNKLFCAK